MSAFNLHRASTVNTAHVVKELDILCSKSIESLSDVCRFTVRIQSLIDKPHTSAFALKSDVASWLQECDTLLQPLIGQQIDLGREEDDIDRRKVEILYHKLGREIELATCTPDVSMRAIRHGKAVSTALQDEYHLTDMSSVIQFDKALTVKMDAIKSNLSLQKVLHDWTSEREGIELRSGLQKLLTVESNALIMTRLHADISRQIHSTKIQALSVENRISNFVFKALLFDFSEKLKLKEKLFLWEKRCELQARKTSERKLGIKYKPQLEFGLDLLSAMYNEEHLQKYLSYLGRASETNQDETVSSAPTPTPSVKLDADTEELFAIPEFVQQVRSNPKSRLAEALKERKKITSKKLATHDQTEETFAEDLLGVKSQAEKLKSYAEGFDLSELQDEVESCLNITSDDDDLFIPSIHDDLKLEVMKREVITDLTNAWKVRIKKYAQTFCDAGNPDSVLSRISAFVTGLEKDPTFSPAWKDEKEKERFKPYFDLACFAKHEMERANHQSLVVKYPNLMMFVSKLKQAAYPVVSLVKDQMKKQNGSPLETAGFILGGVGLGILVVAALIVTHVLVLAALAYLLAVIAPMLAGGGSLGFGVKQITNYIQHLKNDTVVETQLSQIKKLEITAEMTKPEQEIKNQKSINAHIYEEVVVKQPMSLLPTLRPVLPPAIGSDFTDGFEGFVSALPELQVATEEIFAPRGFVS